MPQASIEQGDFMKRKLVFASALLASAGWPAMSQAQELLMEEIVVTARLRSEGLMDVPMAVNVFTDKAIERAGISRPEDFIGLVPNMTIVQSQDAGTSFITVRGLTQVRNSESPVALVIDGVLAASSLQLNQEMFDIEQIEVMKGPQGALYGRNAIGGAITIRTKQPTNEMEGWVRVGTGDAGRTKAQGTISGPLVQDKLFFRISGSHVEHDGQLQNIFLQEKADPYQDRSARLLLAWTPNDRVTVDVRASTAETTGGALYFVVNSDLFTGGPDFVGDPNDTSVPIRSNIRGTDKRTMHDASLRLNYDSPVGTITSVSAWNDLRERSAGDAAPYSSLPIDGTQDGFVDVRAVSQELRFTSPGDRPLRYIIGAYLLGTDREAQITSGLDKGAGILKPGINPNDPDNPTTFAFWDNNDNLAWAGFAQVNYDLTDSVELAGAIRYDRDRREQRDLSPYSPTRGQVRKESFDKWQPKLSLTWRPNKDLSLYGSYSEGFRSGGFNQPGVAAVAASATPPLRGVQDIYDKESSRTAEFGLKSSLADRRLRLNAAIFASQLNNQQYFSFIPQVVAQITTNIDRVNLWGIEADAAWRISSQTDLFAGFGYTDSEIKRYVIDPSAVGKRSPYVPEYTATLGVEHTVDISQTLEMLLRLEYERRGSQYWEPNNLVDRNPVDLVKARITLQDADDTWSVAAWARNLFNETYNEEFVLGGFVQRAQPRSLGVDLMLRF